MANLTNKSRIWILVIVADGVLRRKSRTQNRNFNRDFCEMLGENVIVRRVPRLWAFGSVFLIVVGVVAGAANGGDRALHDAYYTSTFFLYPLMLAAIFIIFAGVYRWLPKLTGYLYSEKLAHVHFWLMFVGVNLTILPQLCLRLWKPLPGSAGVSNTAEFWNSVSAIGAFIIMAGLGVFVIVVAEEFIRKRGEDSNA